MQLEASSVQAGEANKQELAASAMNETVDGPLFPSMAPNATLPDGPLGIDDTPVPGTLAAGASTKDSFCGRLDELAKQESLKDKRLRSLRDIAHGAIIGFLGRMIGYARKDEHFAERARPLLDPENRQQVMNDTRNEVTCLLWLRFGTEAVPMNELEEAARETTRNVLLARVPPREGISTGGIKEQVA